MKLSTRSRYGVRLLADLALHHEEAPIRLHDISKRQDLPVKYLEQIIRGLKKEGIIKSVRGGKGGYLLNMPPEEITFGKVIRIFETQAELVKCVVDPSKCKRADDCIFRNVWKKGTDAFLSVFDSITLADIIAKENGKIICDKK